MQIDKEIVKKDLKTTYNQSRKILRRLEKEAQELRKMGEHYIKAGNGSMVTHPVIKQYLEQLKAHNSIIKTIQNDKELLEDLKLNKGTPFDTKKKSGEY